MRVEILAVGTELLLGQIADTNGQWMGEHLAAAGIDSYFHQAVGDNRTRIVTALRTALARGDAVIASGGLGPTQDDITREAIAEVMNVRLVRDDEIARRIEGFFQARGRVMTENNLRQADVPEGATVIDQTRGTAPGLICPVGRKVVYAVPGVPHEMAEMFERAVLPDLRRRKEEAGEGGGVIVSRVLRTWGTSESALSEALQGRIDALDALDAAAVAKASTGAPAGTVTIAFLASGIEGIKVRLTARARDAEDVRALLDAEEKEVRAALAATLGDVVFGLDDVSMEQAVASLLVERHLTLGVAESLTGGLVAARLVDVPGASSWFRGGVVAYDSAVKFSVLGVPEGPVVTEEAAVAMALGARRVLGAEVGLGITGVAGPDSQEGLAPGTVFVALALPGGATPGRRLRLPGDRERVRQYSAISALDLLRRTLLTPEHGFEAPTLG
jgi:nicotinamide-nucleotide amidase